MVGFGVKMWDLVKMGGMGNIAASSQQPAARSQGEFFRRDEQELQDFLVDGPGSNYEFGITNYEFFWGKAEGKRQKEKERI